MLGKISTAMGVSGRAGGFEFCPSGTAQFLHWARRLPNESGETFVSDVCRKSVPIRSVDGGDSHTSIPVGVS